MGAYNYFSTETINEDVDQMISEQVPLVIMYEQLTTKMFESASLVRGYFLYQDDSLKEDYELTLQEIKDIEQDISKVNQSEQNTDLITKRQDWEDTIDQAISEFDRGDETGALNTLTGLKTITSDIQDGYRAIATTREEAILTDGQSVISKGKRAILITLITSIMAFSGGIIIALITARSISKPLNVLKDRMEAVSNGDLSHEPLVIHAKDEVAQLMEMTNVMSNNNKRLLRNISSVSETVSSQSEELTQSASEVKAGTEQVAVTMEELAQAAERQANSAGDLASVMNTFTNSVEGVSQHGKQVEENSQHVLQLTTQGTQLMHTSTEQMAAIDHIVKDAVQKMQLLDQQSQQISKLVDVIRDVADQTNLLALNAAIEAARAGESGKGFAVVADEVRKLAEQVALSVNDITGIVTTIQTESNAVADSLDEGYKQVEAGSQQLLTTSDTFNQIRDAITGMATNINQIVDQLADITAGSQEMGGSIDEIASVSEEAAAGVEETAASAEQASSSMEEVAASSSQLAELAENLNGLVGRFKL